jgi:hypothetical protein
MKTNLDPATIALLVLLALAFVSALTMTFALLLMLTA